MGPDVLVLSVSAPTGPYPSRYLAILKIPGGRLFVSIVRMERNPLSKISRADGGGESSWFSLGFYLDMDFCNACLALAQPWTTSCIKSNRQLRQSPCYPDIYIGSLGRLFQLRLLHQDLVIRYPQPIDPKILTHRS